MTTRALPIALIAIGAIWLLFAVGFVPPSLGAALARLWPLLLVGAGLDMLMPERRPRDVPFVALAAAVILLVGLFWPASALQRPATEVHHDLPPTTERVSFSLRASSPVLNVRSADSDDTLVTARFTGEPRGVVAVDGAAETRVRLSPERAAFRPFVGPARWDVEVPRAVPLDVQVDGGSGPITLDLVGTQLVALELEAGSGPATADLPGGGRPYVVSVDGGSGPIELRVAPGASLNLEADLGSGPATVFIGEGSDAVVALELGSGPLELDLPDTAPIRLTVQDDGSGPLRLPRFLERRSGSGDTGVWESPSLRNGGRVIDIVLEDVGSGPVTVR
ncbi:MAG TPA: DUF5668 domain-containing protein [Trueperaceae bacterium]